MLSQDNLNGLLAVLAGMLLFKSTTYIPVVEGWIKDYPIVVVVIALVLFFNRTRITNLVFKKKNGSSN